LKQFDAGQFGATLVAQFPPDAADASRRLKQIEGRVREISSASAVRPRPTGGRWSIRASTDSVKVSATT